ncbi:MAG: hypothetical protein AB9Q18_02440 [Candidatus Reddybacter sp.]
MNVDTVLCLSDSHLTVYRYASRQLSLEVTYDLSQADSLGHFSSWLQREQSRTTSLLLDLSCEDYYEEQLPHVRGRDRSLLLSRKIAKLFPDEGYACADLATRLKAGRRDDVYFISGIADTSSLAPVINALADNDVAVRGVYSLPQLAPVLVEPIEHPERFLLVTCDEDATDNSRYIFRQTYIVNKKLYFSRKTAVAIGDGNEIVDGARKEIERTWQYLNNRRALELDSRMQVLMILPRQILASFKVEPEASNCDYIYADIADMATHNAYAGDHFELTSSSLGAFILANTGAHKTHYQPERLGLIKRHQQIRQFLSLACVIVVILAVVFTAMNIKHGVEIKDANDQLASKSSLLGLELEKLQQGFQYSGPAPKKLKGMVDLSRQILKQSALPSPIFSVISSGFSDFNDLLLTHIEWRVLAPEGSAKPRKRGASKSKIATDQSTPLVVVSMRGELVSFDGDFRHAIERLQLLIGRLRADERVVKVVAHSLPLDIDPSLKISRKVSDLGTPSFSIDVSLNLDAM